MGTGGRPGRTKARELRVAEPPDAVSRAARLLPILGWLPAYRRDCFFPDFLAGLAVWGGMGPQAVGYSRLRGGPPPTGLYTILPPLGACAAPQGKRAAARDLLAPVYAWFTEGFDTRDLQEAKTLLGTLA